MPALALRLSTLALVGVLPLILSTHVEDVFMLPWRAGLWAWLGAALVWTGGRWAAGKGRLPRISPAGLPWVLFGAWALAATAWSANPADCLRRTLELTGTVAAFWLGRACARQGVQLRTLALGAASVCSAYGLLQFLGIDPLPWSTHFGARAFGTLANPDYYAGHLTLVLPVAFAALIVARGGALLVAAAAALLTAGFLLSQVRGAWLASGAAAAWMAWCVFRGGPLRPVERARLARGAAAAAGMLALAFALSSDFRGRLTSLVAVRGYDATGRRFLWTVAEHVWRERPLAGFGTGSFKFEFPRHQAVGLTMGLPQFRSYNYSEHAHNEILQFGAELGAVGVVLFAWGVLAWWWVWRGRVRTLAAAGRRRAWWEEIGLGAGIAGVGAYTMVNFPFQIVPTAALIWILLGVSTGRAETEQGGWTLPPPLARAAGSLLMLAGLGGAILAARDMPGSGYYMRLRALGEQGDWHNAVGWGLRAQRLLPWDYRVARWLTHVAIEDKNEPLAEAMIALRLKLHPQLADAIADRALLSLRAGRKQEALERFEALVRDHPNFASGWEKLAGIYFERGEIARAADAFGRQASYQALDPVPAHQQASALGILKRYPEALAADQEALRRDPKFVEGWIGVALSYRALGRKAEARAAALRAFQLEPANPRAATIYSQLR